MLDQILGFPTKSLLIQVKFLMKSSGIVKVLLIIPEDLDFPAESLDYQNT